ncbi:hypothetical protein GCM10018965_004090 [Nonomuraea roseola]
MGGGEAPPETRRVELATELVVRESGDAPPAPLTSGSRALQARGLEHPLPPA